MSSRPVPWSRHAAGPCLLRFCDLSAVVRPEGDLYRLLGSENGKETAILEGGFFVTELRSGLAVHATDAVEQRDGATESMLQPGLTALLLLDGRIDAELGGRCIRIRSNGGATGMIWSITEPTRLVRRMHNGVHVRKVVVTVTPDWLHAFENGRSGDRLLSAFEGTQSQIAAWRPDATAIRCAEEIIRRPGEAALLDRISLELSGLTILRTALSMVLPADGTAEEPDARRAGARDVQRARLARGYLDRNLTGQLTVDEAARACGMSVSSLQRIFKAVYGMTIADYLRDRRLSVAMAALRSEGVSVQEAAFRAGYSSPANFATAFKRRFGYPPSACADS